MWQIRLHHTWVVSCECCSQFWQTDGVLTCIPSSLWVTCLRHMMREYSHYIRVREFISWSCLRLSWPRKKQSLADLPFTDVWISYEIFPNALFEDGNRLGCLSCPASSNTNSFVYWVQESSCVWERNLVSQSRSGSRSRDIYFSNILASRGQMQPWQTGLKNADGKRDTTQTVNGTQRRRKRDTTQT